MQKRNQLHFHSNQDAKTFSQNNSLLSPTQLYKPIKGHSLRGPGAALRRDVSTDQDNMPDWLQVSFTCGYDGDS